LVPLRETLATQEVDRDNLTSPGSTLGTVENLLFVFSGAANYPSG
jgi:hypothetical protein